MRSLVGALLNKTPVPQTGRATTGLFAGPTGTRGMTAQMRAMGEVGTLFAIVSRTSNATSQVEWKLWRKAKSGKKEDRAEVVSHPALDLWNQPNKFTTRQELVEAGQQHVDLTGEGWLVIGRNPKVRNLPLELWTVRPDRMAPVESRDDFIAGYTYTAPDGEVVPLERDDVLMLRMPNPLDPYRGMGPVQAILTNIDSAKYSAEWNRNFFLNSAEPGGVIEVPTRLSDAEWAEMNTRWREQHQGVANAHRVAVIEQGKWVNRTFSMRDMQFAELREVSRDVMLEAFGFPKFMLGAVDDVNRANAEASAAMFAQWLVRPRLERWKGMLNNDLLPLYGAVGQGLEFDYENPVPPDGEAENAARDSKVKAVATLVPLGFDADEAMEFFGLPAIKFDKPEPPPAPAPPPAPSGESGAPAAPAEGTPRNVGGSFLELAGRFRTRRGVVARHLGPQAGRTYKRDKDGKFSSGGGYVQGQDLMGGDGAALAEGVVAERGTYEGRSGDPALSAIAHRQGFDGPPQVVTRSEMDALIKSKRPEMLRGVQDEMDGNGDYVPGGKTAAAMQQEMRTGDAYFGHGVYGNGYYFAPPGGSGFSGAEGFGGGEHGAMARATLRSEAKVVGYRQLRQEHDAYFASLGHDAYQSSGLERNPDGPGFRRTTPKSNQDLVFSDIGRFAAARGYDAVKMDDSKKGGYIPPQWLVLNRTALIVEEAQ